MLANGEVTYEGAASPIFSRLVLTAKGLAVLNKVPKLREGKPVPFIQRVRDAPQKSIEGDSAEQITGLITQSVMLGVGQIG